MMGLTPRQAALLAFIEQYIDAHDGIAPSFEEMAAGIGAKAKSSIHRILGQLEDRGFVRRIPGRNRAIEVSRSGNFGATILQGFSTSALLLELTQRGVRLAHSSRAAA